MKKLTIYRPEWLHGEGAKSCLLRSSDNKSCCIGIWARQLLGFTDKQLANLKTMETLSCTGDHIRIRIPEWVFGNYGATVGKFYYYNDTQSISEEHREAMLTELFAAHGIEVEFTG